MHLGWGRRYTIASFSKHNCQAGKGLVTYTFVHSLTNTVVAIYCRHEMVFFWTTSLGKVSYISSEIVKRDNLFIITNIIGCIYKLYTFVGYVYNNNSFVLWSVIIVQPYPDTDRTLLDCSHTKSSLTAVFHSHDTSQALLSQHRDSGTNSQITTFTSPYVS